MLTGVLEHGTLRPEMTTLVTLCDEDVKHGYRAGREFFFLDADTQEEWHMREDRLLEWLRDLADEYAGYEDALRTVRFSIGCILGELSEHLFPWTREEQHAFEAESINILGYMEKFNPECLVARQQLALQAVR
ncbi:MAG: hypothetical protein NVS4B11_25600 [Ktedonobacteraceae bacterium]